MSKRETSLAERLRILQTHCGGSLKALGRFLHVSDVTVKRWIDGFPALPSKLREAARAAGISSDWLAHGIGDPEAVLAKCRVISVDEAETERVEETSPGTIEAIAFIEKHGTVEERAMLASILSGALRNIRERQRAAKSLPPGAQYSPASE